MIRTAEEVLNPNWSGFRSVGKSFKTIALLAMEEYALQFKPKWIEWEGQSKQQILDFDKLDTNRILLKFDDGTICLYDADHPFAIMTHYLVLPE